MPPRSFESNSKVSFCILPNGNVAGIVTVSTQEVVEPVWQVVTHLLEEVDFLLSNDHTFKHLDLSLQLVSEALWIDTVRTVYKLVDNPCKWKVDQDSQTHCQLIEVIIQKVIDNSFNFLHVI